MNVVGSVMVEQGVSFAVIQVHAYTVETPNEVEDAIQTYGKLFPGLPVVLMAVAGAAGTHCAPSHCHRRSGDSSIPCAIAGAERRVTPDFSGSACGRRRARPRRGSVATSPRPQHCAAP